MFGAGGGTSSYEEVENTDLIVLWGSNAREAAGVIHSDMEKGFIRAEIISFEDMIAFGGTAEARTKGRLRVEGKTYLIQDGDIIEIRFNI